MQEKDALALGALLHDIGKLWQCGTQDLQEKYRSHCSNRERHRNFQDCPSCHAEYGYAHAVLSYDFVRSYLGQKWSLAASLASAHHRAQNLGYLSKLVQVADRLSSQERKEHEEGDPAVKQLISVFGQLYGQESQRYFPLEPLGLKRGVLFPSRDLDKYPRQSYDRLWDGFVQEVDEVGKIWGNDASGLLTSLYYLLQKYTWCVPSAYHHDIPDISLFDHLRTTCAIAVGLYRAGISESDVDSLLQEDKATPAWEKPYLSLVGGDISGVQRFLYTQTSKGVARGLRGRSFYLELLTEVVALWVLRQLELPIANLLYAGGGNFYILAHRIGEDTLSKLRQNLAKPLLKHHSGELYVAQDFSPRELKPGNFADVWVSIKRGLGTAKRRRFRELGPPALASHLFAPDGKGDPADTCDVCRREPAPYSLDGEGRECRLCHDLKELGRDLANSDYLLIAPVKDGKAAGQPKEWQKLFLDMDFEVRLLQRPTKSELAG